MTNSDRFDPYYEWLGIPPNQQPPHLYRLLGIEVFEDNPNVIERAADRQMAHVRTFQTGPHAAASQRLLNELAAARLCLLSPEKKKDYDQRLRQELGTAPPPVAQKPPVPPPEPPAEITDFVPTPTAPLATRPSMRRSKRVPLYAQPAFITIVVVAISAALLAALVSVISSPTPVPRPAKRPDRPPVRPALQQDGGKRPVPYDGSPEEVPPGMVLIPVDELMDRPTDPPVRPPWPDPPTLVVQHVEDSSGVILDEFAFCQSISFSDFVDVARKLRPLGYRPIRCRAYDAAGEILIGAVWVRDGLPWRLIGAVTADRVREAHRELSSAQYEMTDVTQIPLSQKLFIALWHRSGGSSRSQEISVDVSPAAWQATAEQHAELGFSIESIHVARQLDGSLSYNALWSRNDDGRSCILWEGVQEELLSSLPAAGTPRDVCLSLLDDGSVMCHCVLLEAPGPPIQMPLATDPQSHLQACLKLAARGYRPASISLVTPPDGGLPLATSLWYAGAVEQPPKTPSGPTPPPSPKPAPKPTPQPSPEPKSDRPAANQPLRFHGRHYVKIEHSERWADLSKAFTAEAWVRLPKRAPAGEYPVMGNLGPAADSSGQSPESLAGWGLDFKVSAPDGGRPDRLILRTGSEQKETAVESADDQWHHVAVVNQPRDDGSSSVILFLDGKLLVEHPLEAADAATRGLAVFLGAPPHLSQRATTYVDLRAFRLSTVARYQDAFTPESQWVHASPTTMVLLDFQPTEDNVLVDITGHSAGRPIVGAEWIAADQPPLEVTQLAKDDGVPQGRPVPDAAALQQAEQRYREVYGDQLKDARSRAEKLWLAVELSIRAAEEEDAAVQYVLFREAVRLAGEGGDLPRALKVIRQWESNFQIDTWAVKAEAVDQALSNTRSIADGWALAELITGLADRAMVNGKAEVAKELVAALTPLGRRLKNAELTRVANARSRFLPSALQLQQQAVMAGQLLATAPDDPKAHLVIGKFLCFLASDWQQGLAHLAKCGEPALKNLADRDLAGAAEPGEQLALAEAWNQWAKGAGEIERNGADQRAQHWLDQCIGKLEGAEANRAARLATELRGRIVRLQLGDGEKKWLEAPPGKLVRLAGHQEAVTGVAVNRSGRRIVSASSDGTVRSWNWLEQRELSRIAPDVGPLRCLALSPDEWLAIVAGDRSVIAVCDLRRATKMAQWDTQQQVSDIVVGSDGRLIWAKAVANFKNLVIADLTTGVAKAELNFPQTPVRLAVSPSGRLGAAANNQRLIRSADFDQGGAVSLTGHERPVADLVFDLRERRLASCDSSMVIVWDLSTGKAEYRFQPPTGCRHLTFLAGGHRLAAAGTIGAIYLWDLDAGKLMTTVHAEATAAVTVNDLAPLPDDTGLVVAGSDGAVYVIRLPD